MNWIIVLNIGILTFVFIMIVIIPTLQVQDNLKTKMNECNNLLESKGYSPNGDWSGNKVGLLDLQWCNKLTKEKETK